jgi:hypothetical protein
VQREILNQQLAGIDTEEVRHFREGKWIVPELLELVEQPSGLLEFEARAEGFRVPNAFREPGPAQQYFPCIVWSYAGTRGERLQHRDDARDCLRQFVSLRRATNQRIWAFAKKYGPLVTCQHGLPCTQGGHQVCPPLQVEPLGLWRHYSNRVAAVLRLAAAIYDGIPGRPEDWSAASSKPPDSVVIEQTPSQRNVGGANLPVAKACRALTAILNVDWVRLVDLTPAIVWEQPATPKIVLRGSGLLGAVATQLLFTACRVEGFAHCAGCGEAFIPNRRPRLDQRSWCERCRKRGAGAQRMRDFRRRKAAQSRPKEPASSEPGELRA